MSTPAKLRRTALSVLGGARTARLCRYGPHPPRQAHASVSADYVPQQHYGQWGSAAIGSPSPAVPAGLSAAPPWHLPLNHWLRLVGRPFLRVLPAAPPRLDALDSGGWGDQAIPAGFLLQHHRGQQLECKQRLIMQLPLRFPVAPLRH